jgi:hypothetical protein
MSKNVVIKLIIVLVVAALVYTAFWFFKIGQVEKRISNFISDNSAYVSAGEVSVSGFPMSQKITIKDLKFFLPSQILNKRQVIVKHLEAKSGIFSSDFSVSLLEPVTVQDAEGNVANVEFSKDPEITIAISDGRISKLNYQDFGYRILDMEKNVIYAATNTLVNVDATVDDNEKITTKITANVKDIEGFDVLDIYKNASEKKVIDGIKTGEIVLGSASTALIPTQIANVSGAAAVAPASVSPTAAPAGANAAMPTNVTNGYTAAVASTAPAPTAPDVSSVPAAPMDTAKLAEVANSNLVKNNFVLDMEYILTPNNQAAEQPTAATPPTNPVEIQEAPTQYFKLVKINSLEFSNPLFKILVNGEMNTFQDDSMPSGSISVKVEKIDTLLSYLNTGLTQIIEQKKPVTTTEVQSSDLASNGMLAEDSYQNFLKRIVANLSPVAKELAAKNVVSKEEVAQFDIRREKNLEFLVNETPLREILGKF